ncbi:MAG: hypothetical protein AB1505_32195 [Candidatus Latescibacterota bacterium]
MTRTDILSELRRLTPRERLEFIEEAVRMLLAEDVPVSETTGRRRILEDAARALQADYEEDSELTSFTALDSAEFHAQG